MMAEKNMVTLRINGKSVTVPEGTNLVDAAETLGIHVPHYCYHPGLTVAANCRICQVEIEGQPKLAFACRTPVADGMVVHTDSEKAKAKQQLIQEFLLCNHPLDCPICDKAGECRLQDYYMEYGQYQPVMIENKYKKHKAVPVGDTIILDTERCILCSRCVRFCDEVSGTSELGIFNRNNRAEIGVMPGREIDNPYSGNLVDVCPVGALGDRDFRFKCRVWYLQTTKSICPGCAKGCNIIVDHQSKRAHKAEGARVMRLRPRHNEDVNGHWMCDEGRYNCAWHDVNRLRGASFRSGESVIEQSVGDALAIAVERLSSSDASTWAVVLSAGLTNEDLYLARRIFAEKLGIKAVFIGPTPEGSSDDLLRRADKNPNTAGAKALGIATEVPDLASVKNVWAIGHDVIANVPGLANRSLDTLIFQGTNICATSDAAVVVLPSATCFEKEGTFTNEDGRVQRLWQAMLPLDESLSDLEMLQRIGQALDVELPAGRAGDVFDALAASESAFSGLTFDGLGEQGALLKTAEGVSA